MFVRFSIFRKLQTLRTFKRCFGRMEGNFSFSFSNYDCVGLDLDHTVCQYKIDKIISLQYKLLTDYLVNTGAYPKKIFSQTLSQRNIDFIHRGLFLDFNKGNVLNIDENGVIITACHGTKKLNDVEIMKIYGIEKKWLPTTKFAHDMLSVWEPPWSDMMRSMMDFTDAQVPLVFAQIIDRIDLINPDIKSYDIWPLILEGIVDMFKPDGSYYLNLYNFPKTYLKNCNSAVKQWLSNLKKNKIIFLLTGAREKDANFLAQYSLGLDWKNYFDYILYDAKKPGFFTKNRQFLNLENNFEMTQGSWDEFYKMLCVKLNKSPKCVYIGDNLLQDVYATTFVKNLHSIAVVEELSEEENLEGKFQKHENSNFVKSGFWNSYIFSSQGGYTAWGSIIIKYSKLCIPSLDYVADKPIGYSFTPFWIENSKL